jgi:hypothetical protein
MLSPFVLSQWNNYHTSDVYTAMMLSLLYAIHLFPQSFLHSLQPKQDAKMSQSIRDKIRSATIGKKTQFRNKIFNYEGVEVEFRSPNLKDRKTLLNRAKDEKGELDMINFIVYSVILNTYIPGTNEKVFDENDYDAMMNQSTGSFVDLFGTEIAEIMNAETDVKKS